MKKVLLVLQRHIPHVKLLVGSVVVATVVLHQPVVIDLGKTILAVSDDNDCYMAKETVRSPDGCSETIDKVILIKSFRASRLRGNQPSSVQPLLERPAFFSGPFDGFCLDAPEAADQYLNPIVSHHDTFSLL
jgi:hypothetical protein